MTPTLATALLYAFFALGFWSALRFVPGKVGRLTFFLGVHAVTLTGWFIITDTAATVASLSIALGVGIGASVVTGFLTGALSIAFTRWLNRSPRFAWAALVPFALPIMALMEPHKKGQAAI